jgi:hypothetical protein
MTRDEFAEWYAANSDSTPPQLLELGLMPYPCHCDSPTCKGWQMVSQEEAQHEMFMGRLTGAELREAKAWAQAKGAQE